jgi:E3 ubiquitin-protein ligase RNF115/126
MRTYRSPDGRFSFSSTTFEAGTSSGQRNNNTDPVVPMMMQSFDTILQGLMEPNPRGYRGYGEESFNPHSSTAPDWLQDDHLTGHHPGLTPRNTDGPQSINRNPMTITEYVMFFSY